MLEILKMIIIYCIGYVHSDTMTFLNEEKNTCNRWRTIYNYCIDLRDLIRSFELNVAIINHRTGGHQLIFKSYELTVAIINLRTGADHTYFPVLCHIRFNYQCKSSSTHICQPREMWCREWRYLILSGSGRLGQPWNCWLSGFSRVWWNGVQTQFEWGFLQMMRSSIPIALGLNLQR